MVHHSVMLPTFGSGNGKLIFLCLLNGVQNLLYCFSMLKKVANFFFFKKIGIPQCTCRQQQRVLTVTQKVLFGEQVSVNVRFSHF